MRFMLTLGVGIVLGYNLHAKRDQSLDTIIDTTQHNTYDRLIGIKEWWFTQSPNQSTK